MQNLVTLPDANELPDAKTLGIGFQRLTLAEQDCHFRMNDDHPSARVQESTSHTQKSECLLSEQRCQDYFSEIKQVNPAKH